jgi:hypothetical protein
MSPQSMRTRMWSGSLLVPAVLLAGAATGCQQYAKVTWDSPKAVAVDKKVPLMVSDLSKLNRQSQLYEPKPQGESIGKHTFTVFAIPVGNLNADTSTPIKRSFDRAVREAVQAAGYELVEADKAHPDSPVLRGEVLACWWWSYSWTWPFNVQGGENKVLLVLETPDGTVLWKKEFSRIEPGIGLGGSYGFDLMIKWSMTKLLEDIVAGCSSDEFKAALAKGAPVALKT